MDNQHIHNLFQSSLNAQQCVQKMLYQKLCFLNLLLYSCTESLDIQANQTFVKIAGLNLFEIVIFMRKIYHICGQHI